MGDNSGLSPEKGRPLILGHAIGSRATDAGFSEVEKLAPVALMAGDEPSRCNCVLKHASKKYNYICRKNIISCITYELNWCRTVKGTMTISQP